MNTSIRARLLAATIATALAIVPAACGDEDTSAEDKSGNAPNGASNASETAPARPATDQGQIKAVAAAVQKAFKTGDGEIVCASLTSAGQRDIARYGRLTGRPGPCVQVASGMARRNAAAGIEPAASRIVAVRVRGDRAVALVRVAGASILRQRYEKIVGEWKIRSLGIGAAVAGDNSP